MTERITDEDIEWLEGNVNMQIDKCYTTLAKMELKLTKAVKELQDKK